MLEIRSLDSPDGQIVRLHAINWTVPACRSHWNDGRKKYNLKKLSSRNENLVVGKGRRRAGRRFLLWHIALSLRHRSRSVPTPSVPRYRVPDLGGLPHIEARGPIAALSTCPGNARRSMVGGCGRPTGQSGPLRGFRCLARPEVVDRSSHAYIWVFLYLRVGWDPR